MSPKTAVVEGDISPGFETIVRESRQVAWDIETSGLDWSTERIATCQLHVPGVGTEIIRVGSSVPDRLRDVLISEHVAKIFHHAPFDLRFMRHHWNASARNVFCTKILSKIVRPDVDPRQHSLKPVLKEFLGVEIDKAQRTSDWCADELSAEQLEYAARDVEYLVPLLHQLMDEARARGVADIAERTFDYLPTRIETDIRGCGDVFAY